MSVAVINAADNTAAAAAAPSSSSCACRNPLDMVFCRRFSSRVSSSSFRRFISPLHGPSSAVPPPPMKGIKETQQAMEFVLTSGRCLLRPLDKYCEDLRNEEERSLSRTAVGGVRPGRCCWLLRRHGASPKRSCVSTSYLLDNGPSRSVSSCSFIRGERGERYSW